MRIEGRVSNFGDGLGLSTRGMLTPLHVLNIHTDNISNFGIPGYQRKDPLVTSFVDQLGPNGVDVATSKEIGRLRLSGNPMDLALASEGYFQRLKANGEIELTRDGRMKLDKEGHITSVDGQKILGADGAPLRLKKVPYNLDKELKISEEGEISTYDPKTALHTKVGKIAIVASDGSVAKKVDIKQGYVEDSNVSLAKEFVSVLPLRRQFEANRQLFILQSDNLSRMIQELGRAQ
jgi:flagellar basal-body rod protein FlgF